MIGMPVLCVHMLWDDFTNFSIFSLNCEFISSISSYIDSAAAGQGWQLHKEGLYFFFLVLFFIA